MDEEQFERHKEFMLQQQAQSAVRVAQMEELLVQFAQAARERFKFNESRAKETDEKLAALINAQIRADDRVAEMDSRNKESAADFDRRLALLLDSQRKTEEAVRKTEETVKQMGEGIRNLAATVDRHIVEGHNGRAGAES
jgi:hypothetical protein